MIIGEGFSLLLYGISFDIYGAEGAGRADVFTTATPYTNFRIYMRNCRPEGGGPGMGNSFYV